MTEKEIHYELTDDGGSNAMYLPIVLKVGMNFYHEFGVYQGVEHKRDKNGLLCILCERMDKQTHKDLM